MATIKAFKALRPKKDLAEKIAALPYDVMNREEALKMAKDNPYSFLHIDRAEIDLSPDIDSYDPKVYQKSRENLVNFYKKGYLIREKTKALYLYRQIMDGRSQTGLLACVAVDESLNGTIKKHEFTKPDKEKDRTENIKACKANTGTILLTYKNTEKIRSLMAEEKKKDFLFDFTSEDKIRHTLWLIDDRKKIDEFVKAFEEVKNLYVADGHHRLAAAENYAKERREKNLSYDKNAEFNFLTAMIAPDEDLYVMDYNRVVKDLNGYSKEEFLKRLEKDFFIKEEKSPYKPKAKREFGMFLDQKRYKLEEKNPSPGKNPVENLDVTILNKKILAPILAIKDPKKDPRIDFVGGIRGMEGLEERVKTDMKVAFSLYPTSISELMQVADQNMIMPAKSTRFEPKVRSGLVVHELEEIV